MEKFNGNRPIWIRVDYYDDKTSTLQEGAIFEGHQQHWANCFFSNAFKRNIENSIKYDKFFNEPGVTVTIREMTDSELNEYKEVIPFCEWLMKTYGEI